MEERARRRMEKNIKTDSKEICCYYVVWMTLLSGSEQSHVAGTLEHGRPNEASACLNSGKYIGQLTAFLVLKVSAV